MEKNSNKLRQLQLRELEILNEFIRICEKHHLKYYLVGGTLLGAVRHHGFIPWDDDIDVGMLREDYEQFAKICIKELHPDYFYQSPETDPHYFLTYAKIRKNETEVYEERFRNAKFHKGVFIDIFPLDFCPKPGLICHLLFNVLAVINYRGQVDSGEEYQPYSELIGNFGYALLKLFSPRKLVDVRKWLLSFSKQLSIKKYLASYSGAYGYYKEIFPVHWFGKPNSICFENLICSMPQEFNLILKQEYGADFMLPKLQTDRRHVL